MMMEKAIRKRASSGVGAALGGVLTLDSAQGWDGWIDAENASLSRDRAMKLSTVSRCVEVRSCSMAMLPVYIMDEGTKERLPGHRLKHVLWDQANEAMTLFDYERLMQANLDLCGNAYAWIRRERATGYPMELIPLRPDHVTPYVTLDSRLYYVYTNPRSGEMFRLDPSDVIHLKGYSTDGIEGSSILQRAAQTVSTGLSAAQTQRELYANGGRPSGVLKTATDLSQRGNDAKWVKADGSVEMISKKEYIRREWDKVHSGSGNHFRLAVLDNGLEYTPVAMSNADAQFVESEEVRVADVCRFFSTPLHLVYAGKESYASNEQNSIEFVKYTLQPLVTAWEQECTRKLLLPSEREQGLRIRRELKALLRGDTAAQMASYKAMRETGAYSVNDIRALEDLPSVPGGETRYASWNYGPLEQFEELSVIRALGGREREGKED